MASLRIPGFQCPPWRVQPRSVLVRPIHLVQTSSKSTKCVKGPPPPPPPHFSGQKTGRYRAVQMKSFCSQPFRRLYLKGQFITRGAAASFAQGGSHCPKESSWSNEGPKRERVSHATSNLTQGRKGVGRDCGRSWCVPSVSARGLFQCSAPFETSLEPQCNAGFVWTVTAPNASSAHSDNL